MTRQLKTGLFVRDDENLGTLVYSPFTGLIFSCLESRSGRNQLIQWLDGRSKIPPNDGYLQSLGAGWACSKETARYPRQHLLSSSGKKHHSYKPDFLLVINWLITRKCRCACRYCYSRDLMTSEMPLTAHSRGVQAIAKSILSHKPLAVVLTGGDPLEEKSIEAALSALHGRAGLIVDTNGAAITDAHLEMFRRYGVFVRVSFDSERPRVNNELRPIKTEDCSLEAALSCINRCLEHRIGVGVQTVITKSNMSDIPTLGNKLYRLGVTSWRLQYLANHSCFEEYDSLKPNLGRFKKTILPLLEQANRTGWDEKMSIQIVENTVSHAVVLVSPEGRFLTELNGKVPLSKDEPFCPSMDQIRQGSLDLDAHVARYLSIGSGVA